MAATATAASTPAAVGTILNGRSVAVTTAARIPCVATAILVGVLVVLDVRTWVCRTFVWSPTLRSDGFVHAGGGLVTKVD